MNDDEIIALYSEKNEEAISETSKKYGAYCRKIAENILGNPEDAEECLNSVWLGVWNSVPSAKPGNLKLFLAKITRNIALNKLKEKTREKRGGKDKTEIFEELSEFIPSDENIEDKIIAKELGKSINDFASNLPKKERDVFIRRYFFMESISVISEKYALSLGSVSVMLHRIRKKLKKHLEKEGYIP